MWHPDRNPDPGAKLKFQEVANAYFVLSDPFRRRDYDLSQKVGEEKVDAFNVFTSVFDDLLIPEVQNPVWFWQPLGALAGIMIGYYLV
jgi:DnaJ-class molecular chaperone